jgi:hypothetical protein
LNEIVTCPAPAVAVKPVGVAGCVGVPGFNAISPAM